MSTPNIDFYSYKGTALPRFVYRHLANALRDHVDAAERQKQIDQFLETLSKQSNSGDFLKMKWVMPPYLRQILRPEEQTQIDVKLAEMRKRRNRKLFDIFPHCSDEFSLDQAFLESTFHADPVPLFDQTTPIFTIGSCFARNIATYLKTSGHNAFTFGQAEDLNSPLSNALMLAVATAPEPDRHAYLRHWIDTFLANPEETKQQVLSAETARLSKLCAQIGQSRLLIVTLGNIIDYFLPADAPHPTLGAINVAPKFLSFGNDEDVNQRAGLLAALKQAGATVRLSSFAEISLALTQLYNALRHINATAPIIFTLSPVPIDSAFGIEKSANYGAVELDCISKSTLRAAIAELLPVWAGTPVYYFPSYEIVRWIGSMLPMPNFGAEDASARHVSGDVLNAIFAFFQKKYGGLPPA